MKLTFVETRVFSRRWHERLDDEGLRALQNVLLEDPHEGPTMPGCGILRKVRFGDPSRGKGKRGGVRVIYMDTPEAGQIDLLLVYGKDRTDDLSATELRAACAVARDIRAELLKRVRRAGRPEKE